MNKETGLEMRLNDMERQLRQTKNRVNHLTQKNTEEEIQMKTTINLDREYWVDAGGRRYEVENMRNSHLINTILYLEREADRLKRKSDLDLLDDDKQVENTLSMIAMYTGEVVTKEKLIKEMWSVDSTDWLKATTTYNQLLKEVRERGLESFLKDLQKREEK